MNLISNKVLDNKKVELEIQVTAEEFKAAVDNAFKKNSKKITLPGFRKGKAPRAMIEKMYGKEIFYDEAINECLPEACMSAIEESKAESVERPEVEIVGDVTEEGFTFKAVFAVKPEVKLGQYKGLQAEKDSAEISEEDIEAELKRIADRNSRMVDVEGREAKTGDTAVIDFEGFKDGVAFEGGKGEMYPLELGSGTFIPGFEEQVAGHNIGDEFDVNVSFPEEYQVEELKGQPVVFKCKLHEIKEKELPEIDDEFAKDISEFDTLEELKADMKAKMGERKAHIVEEKFETELLKKVVEGMEVEIPEAMINSRTEDLIRDFEYRITSQGMNLDMYMKYTNSTMETLEKTFAVQAEEQVKSRLALEAVAAAENIEVTTDEIENEYVKISTQYKVSVEEAKKAIPEGNLKKDIQCHKAIDVLKENAAK